MHADCECHECGDACKASLFDVQVEQAELQLRQERKAVIELEGVVEDLQEAKANGSADVSMELKEKRKQLDAQRQRVKGATV